MFHKLASVKAVSDYRLIAQFADGITKIYDIKPLFEKWETFRELENSPELFYDVKVDTGGYGVVWNDELDISCDELFENGTAVGQIPA